MTTRELFVGLMSGTSLDGVDGALVEFDAADFRLIATEYTPFADKLRRELLDLQTAGPDELDRACRLGNQLSRHYAATVTSLAAKAGVATAAIAAIGCHGQTVRHRPDAGYTLQIGNAALLAELCKAPVVADFRSRDIAAAGQGAPLVPAFHAERFASVGEHRIIINIGGIANLTSLPPGGAVSGFDTGPGNVLLDGWSQRMQHKAYDADGVWARGGQVIATLLEAMLADPYFSAPPPKSTGRDRFNANWLEAFAPEGHAAQDVQATLVELTSRSIADSVRAHCRGATHAYACGGGTHNRALMACLARDLGTCALGTTAELGVDPDWVEAIAFAWLARRTLQGLPGNLLGVTGASGARILGAIYPA